jgi:hypothetical protein
MQYEDRVCNDSPEIPHWITTKYNRLQCNCNSLNQVAQLASFQQQENKSRLHVLLQHDVTENSAS